MPKSRWDEFGEIDGRAECGRSYRRISGTHHQRGIDHHYHSSYRPFI
jgi:hypothetical protein